MAQNAQIAGPPALDAYISQGALARLIADAKREDLGPEGIDVTTESLRLSDQPARGLIRSRQAGVLGGLVMLGPITAAYDRSITVISRAGDGQSLDPGTVVAELTGPLVAIMAMERVALNFMTHLCGIATLTARYVDAVRGTKAKILDTRKTLPGLRAVEKYAVACGGGHNHRMGLYDAVLIKDNHIAHLRPDELANAMKLAVQRSRSAASKPKFVEVEVDTLDQLERVIGCGADVLLLDNMSPDELTQAVSIRDRMAAHIELEASGGVTLDSVREVAQTGIDRIAIGALTHSAPALDLSLDILP